MNTIFILLPRSCPGVGLRGAGGVKDISLGICDGAPWTARSSLNLNGCYGNKNYQQSRLKIEKSPFWTKLKAFGDPFFKNWISAQQKIKKNFTHVVCRYNSYHLLIKYLFGKCLCSISIGLSNVSNLLQKSQLTVFSLFWWPFWSPWQRLK